jgi:hypothetical protein
VQAGRGTAEKVGIMPPVGLDWLFRWAFWANLAVVAWAMVGICAAAAWLLNRLEGLDRPERTDARHAPARERQRPARPAGPAVRVTRAPEPLLRTEPLPRTGSRLH